MNFEKRDVPTSIHLDRDASEAGCMHMPATSFELLSDELQSAHLNRQALKEELLRLKHHETVESVEVSARFAGGVFRFNIPRQLVVSNLEQHAAHLDALIAKLSKAKQQAERLASAALKPMRKPKARKH